MIDACGRRQPQQRYRFFFRNRRPGASPLVNSTPASSSTRWIAARLFLVGVLRPFSKSTMVFLETEAPAARRAHCVVWAEKSTAARVLSGAIK
jgi:hypothetical protein